MLSLDCYDTMPLTLLPPAMPLLIFACFSPLFRCLPLLLRHDTLCYFAVSLFTPCAYFSAADCFYLAALIFAAADAAALMLLC